MLQDLRQVERTATRDEWSGAGTVPLLGNSTLRLDGGSSPAPWKPVSCRPCNLRRGRRHRSWRSLSEATVPRLPCRSSFHVERMVIWVLGIVVVAALVICVVAIYDVLRDTTSLFTDNSTAASVDETIGTANSSMVFEDTMSS
ncbi:hypothetical protein HPB50_007911 [Hyalomma asiaticum]|uniref:Uncharacterized protein n=1 Tax=Hyalomma asiaticum TaxID=266040 RepID=A0ACB7SU36_HYAAI|nr:hypothetical protein HPB50_007911 [Hyalomma asiaticum]